MLVLTWGYLVSNKMQLAQAAEGFLVLRPAGGECPSLPVGLLHACFPAKLLHSCLDMCCFLSAAPGPCNSPLSAHQIPWAQGAARGHRAHQAESHTTLPVFATSLHWDLQEFSLLECWQYMKSWHNLFGLNLKWLVFYLCCTCMVPST